MIRVGFIGAGRMGGALLESFLRGRCLTPKRVLVCDKSKRQREEVERELGVVTTRSNTDLVKWADVVFLCVKPKDFPKVIKEIKDQVEEKIIVSIAAGIPISYLEEHLHSRVVRLMPNAPCLVGLMAGGYSVGSGVTQKDLEKISPLFEAAGVALQVEDSLMDSVTALAGSGPAFISYLVQAFSKAGEMCGLKKEESLNLTIQTFLGTAELLKQAAIDPKLLIKKTCSPKGCTIEGQKILEKSPLKGIILDTVKTSMARSRELSKAAKAY